MRTANWLEKTLMLGKSEGRRRRGQQRTWWLNDISDSMGMSWSKLQEMMKDSKAWGAIGYGVTKCWTRLSDWTTTKYNLLTILIFICIYAYIWASQVALVVKNPPANSEEVRDAGLIPGSDRCPGGSHGNPLQYSCLENPHRQRSLVATIHAVTKASDLSEHLCNKMALILVSFLRTSSPISLTVFYILF